MDNTLRLGLLVAQSVFQIKDGIFALMKIEQSTL